MLVDNKRNEVVSMKRLCKCFKVGSELLCYVEFEENQETYHCLQKAREYFKDDSINGTQLFDERFDLFNETIPLLSICDDEFKRSLLKNEKRQEIYNGNNVEYNPQKEEILDILYGI